MIRWKDVELSLRASLQRDTVLLVSPRAYEATQADQQVHSTPVLVESSFAQLARISVRLDVHHAEELLHVRSISGYLVDGGEYSLAQASCVPPSIRDDKLFTTMNEDATACVSAKICATMKLCIAAFQGAQIAACAGSTNERAVFELELLQHAANVDILLLRSERVGSLARVHVPLVEASEPPVRGRYLPDEFKTPRTQHLAVRPGLVIDVPMTIRCSDLSSWRVQAQYPIEMNLSELVTEVPALTSMASSVDLVATCRESFIKQWRWRRDFIAVLRGRFPILEMDAVDFTRVFFLLKLAPTEQYPMMLFVLCLQFTREYFLTSCTSDLIVYSLDGRSRESKIPIVLAPSSPTLDQAELKDPSRAQVDRFQSALLTSVKAFRQHVFSSQ